MRDMQSDVEIVRAALAALNRAFADGDFRTAVDTWFDPEFEYHPPTGVPEPGPFRGPEFEQFLHVFADPFDEVWIEIEDVRESGGHVFYRQRGNVRGGASGMDVADQSYAIATVREGKLIRIVEDYDESDALRRAGLG
jgi:ketosteroid isomerase-like protein